MSKIRKSARGQDCTVRIPGICNFNPETVVLAHRNGGGIATKKADNEAAYCCSSCHDVLDGRVYTKFSSDLIKLWHLEGVMRTQEILIRNGLMILK